MVVVMSSVIVVVVFMVMIVVVSGAAARSTVVLLTFIILLAYILFTLILIFSTIYTSFPIFIETVSTQDVTVLAIFVKAINALAAVITLPTISLIQICGSIKECAVKISIIIILAASHTVYVKTS